jgi:hypothetical protein
MAKVTPFVLLYARMDSKLLRSLCILVYNLLFLAFM